MRRAACACKRGRALPWRVRLAVGACIVAACIGVPACAQAVSAAQGGAVLSLLGECLDGQGFLSRNDALPEGFAEEIVSGEGFDDVRASDDGGVVGLLSAADAQAVFADLDACLQGKGWARVGQEQLAATTYMKQSGRYRWLELSLSSINGHTSVVLVVR